MGDGHLAFVCAMPMELTPLARDLALTEMTEDGAAITPRSPRRTGRRRHRDRDGHRARHRGHRGLLDRVGSTMCSSSGITGALENDTPIGTLVLPEIVVEQRDRT